MTTEQKIALRLSEVRSRLNEIAGMDELTDETRSESDALATEYKDLEIRNQAAIIAAGERETRMAQSPDAETRERMALRSQASLTNFLTAAAAGRRVSGAEAELRDAAGVADGAIPLELWDTAEVETRAVTDAPGTVGVNLDRIRPAVFANSIAPRLGIDMPRVMSGTYASATITGNQAAEAKAKSAAIASTAGAFTVTTATPKRISARLELTLEDIAAVGQANFESALRQNLSLALSDALDDAALNGDGQNNKINGIFQRLTDPSDPAAGIADFDDFVDAFAGGIDGLWASTTKDVSIVAGVDAYRLSAKMFRDATGQDLGDTSFADYARQHFGGWWTSKRMPATASHIQQAILYRKGRSMQGGSGGMRTAVCPHWNQVSIDDMYTGSAKAERYFTMHVLLGDVILVQPDAYAQVAFRVSS